ncbi:MAG: aldo/keto reductase [Bacteroidales bacterium]|jgi:predicted oxidoreductase|nr:aldo/keto reductase [Bacteroidales bacterium]
MEKVFLTEEFSISPLIHGYWRLLDWKLTNQELLQFLEELIELGITTFDHANIYGDYECEKTFGEALKLNKTLRKDIQLITKCGIQLISDKYPARKIKHYDYSYDHLVSSVNQSLQNFDTDYIDLLLLHRPAPFWDPEEIAKAFNDLKKSGKVLHFGVSNFNPNQFKMLNSFVQDPLVTNQLEISPFHLEHFENGNLDFLQMEKIRPMAWSPTAGGRLFNPKSQKELRIYHQLQDIAEELDIGGIDKIIYSWLFKHPARIIPVIGSGKMERIRNALEAMKIDLSIEQWYKIYSASRGEEVP